MSADTKSAGKAFVGSVILFGVLKLTLGSSSYEWEFVPIAGESFRDSGRGVCH